MICVLEANAGADACRPAGRPARSRTSSSPNALLGGAVRLVAGRGGVREVVGELVLAGLLGEHAGRSDVEAAVHQPRWSAATAQRLNGRSDGWMTAPVALTLLRAVAPDLPLHGGIDPRRPRARPRGRPRHAAAARRAPGRAAAGGREGGRRAARPRAGGDGREARAEGRRDAPTRRPRRRRRSSRRCRRSRCRAVRVARLFVEPEEEGGGAHGAEDRARTVFAALRLARPGAHRHRADAHRRRDRRGAAAQRRRARAGGTRWSRRRCRARWPRRRRGRRSCRSWPATRRWTSCLTAPQRCATTATGAPRVVAAGTGELARRIVETARRGGRRRPRGRRRSPRRWRVCSCEAEVPEELWRAVAEVLVWAQRLDGAARASA